MKKIVICDKEYEIDCNALTYIKYKTFFKNGIIEDVQVLQDYLIRQTVIAKQVESKKTSDAEKVAIISNYMNKYIDSFIIAVTKIAWILIYTANKNIEEYEKWLEKIPKLEIDADWIVEVTEFAVDCFCR